MIIKVISGEIKFNEKSICLDLFFDHLNKKRYNYIFIYYSDLLKFRICAKWGSHAIGISGSDDTRLPVTEKS